MSTSDGNVSACLRHSTGASRTLQCFNYASKKRYSLTLHRNRRSMMYRGSRLHPSLFRPRKPRSIPAPASIRCPQLAEKLERRYHSKSAPLHRPILIPSESLRVSKSHNVFARARRRFSNTAVPAHGHVTPPKPGEEYAIRTLLS